MADATDRLNMSTPAVPAGMHDADRAASGAARHTVETAIFDCDRCGATARTTAIAYDPLGYPVCPDCGAETRPTA